ncbi:MAG TPA: sulfotransferase family 2 domain-containing protein [Rhizomicrobium sp.]|nr:sulfotransferase family 2 domain-containing protein [Rhizomicrobium sp.]
MSVAYFDLPAPFADSKRINYALFGAYYEEDIYDRACAALPLLARGLWWRMPEAMRRRKLIFVHVPRVAGMSIVRALYGQGCIHHFSMRYYRAIDPRLAAEAESFALLRHPVDRFASAYAFVKNGGTAASRLSDVFAAQTAHIASVDDYLSFLEDRGALDLDFVMRPQSWFVCGEDGAVLVKRLFLYEEDRPALGSFLKSHGIAVLPWLNRTERTALRLTPRQLGRIERLYASDFALIASVRAARRSTENREPWSEAIRLAAE